MRERKRDPKDLLLSFFFFKYLFFLLLSLCLSVCRAFVSSSVRVEAQLWRGRLWQQQLLPCSVAEERLFDPSFLQILVAGLVAVMVVVVFVVVLGAAAAEEVAGLS